VHLNEDIFTEPLRYDPFRLMPGLPPFPSFGAFPYICNVVRP
jgi:hypothetical protein